MTQTHKLQVIAMNIIIVGKNNYADRLRSATPIFAYSVARLPLQDNPKNHMNLILLLYCIRLIQIFQPLDGTNQAQVKIKKIQDIIII